MNENIESGSPSDATPQPSQPLEEPPADETIIDEAVGPDDLVLEFSIRMFGRSIWVVDIRKIRIVLPGALTPEGAASAVNLANTIIDAYLEFVKSRSQAFYNQRIKLHREAQAALRRDKQGVSSGAELEADSDPDLLP